MIAKARLSRTRGASSASQRVKERRARRRPNARAHETPSPLRIGYSVQVADEQRSFPVRPAWVRHIVRAVLAAEKVRTAVVSVALVNNAAMRRLNREHLNHDFATDVLSFLFESARANGSRIAGRRRTSRGEGLRIDGEIIVSVEMAAQCAESVGWQTSDELALYLVHGILHLCGYDDRTERDCATIRERERAILSALGIAVIAKAQGTREDS